MNVRSLFSIQGNYPKFSRSVFVPALHAKLNWIKVKDDMKTPKMKRQTPILTATFIIVNKLYSIWLYVATMNQGQTYLRLTGAANPVSNHLVYIYSSMLPSESKPAWKQLFCHPYVYFIVISIVQPQFVTSTFTSEHGHDYWSIVQRLHTQRSRYSYFKI